MSDRPIRILLVDDHALFRHGLRQLLATTDDLVVVGEAATGRQALELVARLRPDVVLMDIAMPDLDGLLATQALHRQFPELRIVMLTMYEAMTYGAAARAAGASAYVVKSSHPDDLFAAIRAAANGAAHRPNGVDTPTLPEHARLPEDRMAHLERRVQWLESQWAVLAARHAAATQPEAPAVSQPAPDDVRSSSEAMPKPASPARQTGASHLFRRMPVAAATTRQAPTVVPRSSRQLPPWLFVGATLLAAAIASAGLLAPPPLAALGRWIALLAGIAVAALLATYAAVRNARPVLAHLLLLLALGTALAWSLAVSWREPLPLRGLGLGSLVLVALLVLALAWRRGFLLAAAFALAIVSVAPFALAFPLSRLALLWVTATVGAATSLAWRRLDGDGTPVAWEWLPLAPLSAGLPLVLPWHEHSDAPYLFLLGIPWLALVPVLWRATRLGRGSVTAVFLVAALSYLGTFGWRLSRTPPATQAAALALVAGAFALLALLLRQAGQGRSPRPAPWETAAGLAGLALATSAARHPDPVLAPVTWNALATLVLVSERDRGSRQWVALAAFVAGCFATLHVVRQPSDPARIALALGAITLATAAAPFAVQRSWLRLAWLANGALALGLATRWRLEGVAEIAALSGLALGALLLARFPSPHRSLASDKRWLPAAGLGIAAVLAALTGPLSPARLGLSLSPTVPATSEPVVAATVLVAAALAAGRLLGRRWRWAAVATALLVVAYTLPAVLPDAALLVSWLALAVALGHALGARIGR